jgi:hypothetical protein
LDLNPVSKKEAREDNRHTEKMNRREQSGTITTQGIPKATGSWERQEKVLP